MKVAYLSNPSGQNTVSSKKIERQRLIDDLVIKITLENNARVRAKREATKSGTGHD